MDPSWVVFFSVAKWLEFRMEAGAFHRGAQGAVASMKTFRTAGFFQPAKTETESAKLHPEK